MGFSGSSNGGSIGGASDSALSNPAANDLLTYDGSAGKWKNKPALDATNTSNGAVRLAGDLGGTAVSPTVPGLLNKEPLITAGTASQYFRGDKTFQTLATVATSGSYSDLSNQPTIPTVSDATSTSNGLVRLAGDLSGSASAPTVPGLTSKEPAITAGTASQYFRGDKTFQTLDKTAVGLANIDNTSDVNKPVSTAVQSALNLKADATTVGTKTMLIANAAALPAGTPAGVIVVVQS